MTATNIKLNATRQRAFTLKELLILMIGIVLLVSIVLPSMSKQKHNVQYRAAAEVLSSHKNAVIRYAYRYDNYWGLPDTELSPAEMKRYFGIDDTDSIPNLGPIGGIRGSLNNFSVYQNIDKDAFHGSEEAPEMLAMTVHLTTAGDFEFEFHYYHSDYDWNYAAGEAYVDFEGLIEE